MSPKHVKTTAGQQATSGIETNNIFLCWAGATMIIIFLAKSVHRGVSANFFFGAKNTSYETQN